MTMRTLAAAALLLAAAVSAAAAAAADNNNNNDDDCGLYLAVSSSSDADFPKWGLYTGVTIPNGGLVGPPEIAIQTHNLMGNALSVQKEETSRVKSVQLFEEYIWVADATAGKRELQKGRIVSAIPGAGVLGGYNAKLTNADWDHSGAFFKYAIGESPQKNHPGRGASSGFYNVTLRSKEEISVGAEIFLDYGESWGTGDDDDAEDEELTKKDYVKVDQLVDQMIDFFAKYEGELTEAAKSEIFDFLILDIVNAAAGPKKGKNIHMMLPKNADDLIKVKEAGGTLKFSQPSSVRDLEWLKKNGKCMDQLVLGASTIPHAGRGAFAKRKIQKGGLVSPVPLVHIPDKTMMDMHEVTRSIDADGEKYYHRVNDEVIGQQLLLNYCYGHPETSMLFYPAGSMSSFINHSAKKPNAKMQFSDHKQHQQDWLTKSPEDLMDDDHAFIGLMIEIVALRDIKEGEEVLMDYGPEWQTAWNAHLKTWEQHVKKGDLPNPWPIRALDLNEEYKTKAYPTIKEGAEYSENIRQMCFLVVQDVKEEPGVKRWAVPKKGTVYDNDNLFDCAVLERIELEEAPASAAYNYTVEWYDDEEDGTKVIHVPHDAIVFVDKPLTSDQFITQAFRHHIGIPDDVFPTGPWRNLV